MPPPRPAVPVGRATFRGPKTVTGPFPPTLRPARPGPATGQAGGVSGRELLSYGWADDVTAAAIDADRVPPLLRGAAFTAA
jgi:hypothetical protein